MLVYQKGIVMDAVIDKLVNFVGRNAKTILEIGTCEGGDSLKLLNNFPHANLFCFEPDPKNCNDHRNKVNNDRCILTEAAICNNNEMTIFHRSGGRDRRASGSIKQPKDHLVKHPWCTFNEDIAVKCFKLDTWCERNGISEIDLIWADVNGAEKDMITGAQEILKKVRFLYTEFSPSDMEIYQGSIKKEQIKSLLQNFEEILTNGNNILLKNKDIT